MTRQEILETAIQYVTVDRANKYGSPEDNFSLIASFWSEYLGHPINRLDVAMMMVLLKVARVSTGASNPDNFPDIAGYAACGGEMLGKDGSGEAWH